MGQPSWRSAKQRRQLIHNLVQTSTTSSAGSWQLPCANMLLIHVRSVCVCVCVFVLRSRDIRVGQEESRAGLFSSLLFPSLGAFKGSSKGSTLDFCCASACKSTSRPFIYLPLLLLLHLATVVNSVRSLACSLAPRTSPQSGATVGRSRLWRHLRGGGGSGSSSASLSVRARAS